MLRRFAPLRKRFAFVAGNDTQTHFRILAAQSARVLLSTSRPQSEGAGNAGRRVRPPPRVQWSKVKSTRVSQVTPESPGIPHAMVYGLLRDLPGARALWPPSPLRSLLLKNLTPASRRQDHTTSPSASGALVRSTLRVHRIPPRVRDDREPPLRWDGTSGIYP